VLSVSFEYRIGFLLLVSLANRKIKKMSATRMMIGSTEKTFRPSELFVTA